MDIDTRFFPETAAGGFSRLDGTIQFYSRVHSLLHPGATVLDFGAGRGASVDDPSPYRRDLRRLKGKVREVIGVDIDPAVKTNPTLDRAIAIEPDQPIPLPDRSVDLVLSDFTFEHIDNPAFVSRELDRVLAPGGWICARTPNRYGYIGLANTGPLRRLLSGHLHRIQPGRKSHDVFPATYRLNSPSAIRRYFPADRYRSIIYGWNGEPAYHYQSALLYRIFLFVHALTPNCLKTTLFVFLQKRLDP